MFQGLIDEIIIRLNACTMAGSDGLCEAQLLADPGNFDGLEPAPGPELNALFKSTGRGSGSGG